MPTLKQFFESRDARERFYSGLHGRDAVPVADITSDLENLAPSRLERQVRVITSGPRTFVHKRYENGDVGELLYWTTGD